jgi:hypothetical protein
MVLADSFSVMAVFLTILVCLSIMVGFLGMSFFFFLSFCLVMEPACFGKQLSLLFKAGEADM